jgi:hypothetical protein
MKTNIKNLIHWRRVIAIVCLLVLVLLSRQSFLWAQTVTEGFNSDEQLQRGMIVSIEKDQTKLKATTKDTAKDMHGIVVSSNDTPVTLAQEGQQYFVATIGHFDVLVSNQSGDIKKGDFIAISALPGVGMKAGDKDAIIAGRAMSDFDPKKDIVSVAKLKDTAGKEFEVAIGRIQVQINIARNPLLKATEAELPDALKRITDTVAGKQVSALRGYIALTVFVLSTVAAASLMYGGVRSAITSVGRNPLSKKSIIRSMLQVIVSGLIIFITGLFGVYLILKL